MILTLEDYKEILNITGNTNDQQINILIPIVQQDIISYTKNSFRTSYEVQSSNISFVSSTKTINVSNDLPSSGDITIEGSRFNDGNYTISSVTSTTVVTTEDLNDESACKLITLFYVKYPSDLKVIASRMINYLINNGTTVKEIKSERLGDYSATFVDVGSNSYPENIVSGLNKYNKVRMK